MSNISFSSGYGEYVSGEFLGGLAFELKSKGIPLFSREFVSSSPNFVNLTENLLNLTQHSFVTGEELIYNFNLDTGNTPIRIESTVISGVSTDILPGTVYAIKEDFSSLKLAATKEDALLKQPINLNFSAYGKGTHRISSKNPNKNALITINNVIQNPVTSTGTTASIQDNITEFDLSVEVDDISTLKSGDLLKIDDEIVRVLSVAVESENTITFVRSVLGTVAAPHTQNSVLTKVNANYNIVDNFIYFASAPYGNIFDLESGLKNNSTFSGRVFTRSGINDTSIGPYDNNYIFDDISPEFTGVDKFFTLKEDSSDITGISTDNIIFTINEVFQPPSRLTGNTINGAYTLIENAGITSVTFTGNDVFPKYDVNISEYPRGGIIFAIGSTSGLGYQPLISAGGTAIVSAAGTIQAIAVGYSGSGYREQLQTVNVGVGYSDVVNFDLEIVGTASILNGNITDVVITNPGSGYTNTNPPIVYFDPPLSYSNIPLRYSSESSGIGTEATIDIVVGQGSSVINFNINKLGYSYSKGDILTVDIGGQVGIPTVSGSEFKEFQILVDQIYNDSSSLRSIGQLIIFDPIDKLFDGKRRSFPLRLNNEQTSVLSRVGSDLEVENCMLIFIDNILQVPGESYDFSGGSILRFKEAPRAGSTSTILFYAGTDSIDTQLVEIIQTVKIGDTLQIFDNSNRNQDQDQRTVNQINAVDVVRTNLYNKQGISEDDEIRPVKWCPQNVDKFIAGAGLTDTNVISKDRVIYEPMIYPTAYVIAGIGSTSSEIFVDSVKTFFDNATESPTTNDIRIFAQEPQIPASLSVTLSAAGNVQLISTVNPGLGYNFIPKVSISSPVGVGTTAVATISLDSKGSILSVEIVNAGSGYTSTSPVFAIVEPPRQRKESATEVSYEGDFGTIVGIGTTSMGSTNIAIFDLFIPLDSVLRNSEINPIGSGTTGLSAIFPDYYFYISNSNVGNLITSLDNSEKVIGIGTTFMDNVYQVFTTEVKQKNVVGVGTTLVNEVLVKVQDNSSLTGITTSGFFGNYSWGRIFDVSKSGIGTFNAYAPGITTSTVIQRLNPLKFLNYTG